MKNLHLWMCTEQHITPYLPYVKMSEGEMELIFQLNAQISKRDCYLLSDRNWQVQVLLKMVKTTAKTTLSVGTAAFSIFSQVKKGDLKCKEKGEKHCHFLMNGSEIVNSKTESMRGVLRNIFLETTRNEMDCQMRREENRAWSAI